MRCSLQRALWIGLPLLALAASAQADEFVLATGARIRGEWLNHEERGAAHYLIKTEYGGNVQLDRSQVSSVNKKTAVEHDYDRIAPGFTDTIEGQWELANWCRQRGLKRQREQHLQRIVELDPEHVPARRALGYSEIGGRWVMPEEHLKQQGYIRYKGKWRLRQDIELAQSRRAIEIAKKEWFVQLKRWRSRLDTENAREAHAKIIAVRDPLAIDALGRLLDVEHDRRVRLLLVDVLGQIEGHPATAALISHSLTNGDDEVFHACVDQLVRRSNPLVVRQYVQALGASNNQRVNRAAHALGRIGDQSVVSPLIDALVTRHQLVIPGDGATTTTFSSGPQAPEGSMRGLSDHVPATVGPGQTIFLAPGEGWSISSGGSRSINHNARNQEVLQALVKLTRVSFSFDQRAWRNWYGLQSRSGQSGSVNSRRGS